jgi:hypothetical protein
MQMNQLLQHTFVLSRRVGRAPAPVDRALPALTLACHRGLTFTGPFEHWELIGPWGSGPAERRAHAQLRTGRRTVEPVEVELGPWDRSAVEVRLRPLARRPERWGRRRQERYFDGAHAAVDALTRAIEQTTPSPTTAMPVRRSA